MNIYSICLSIGHICLRVKLQYHRICMKISNFNRHYQTVLKALALSGETTTDLGIVDLEEIPEIQWTHFLVSGWLAFSTDSTGHKPLHKESISPPFHTPFTSHNLLKAAMEWPQYRSLDFTLTIALSRRLWASKHGNSLKNTFYVQRPGLGSVTY